jgi:hypothetical protein
MIAWFFGVILIVILQRGGITKGRVFGIPPLPSEIYMNCLD